MNKNVYNKWYWQTLAIPAAQRLIGCWKNENRNNNFSFENTPTVENFEAVIVFLHKWQQERDNIDESLKRDIYLITNFDQKENKA